MIHYLHLSQHPKPMQMNYGEYSNTPLEGTNYGLKHASVSTHPGLSMDNFMVILSVQSDKHVVKTNGVVIRDNKRHSLNYVNSVMTN